MKKLLLFFILIEVFHSSGAEVVIQCNIGTKPTVHVDILRDMKVADTWEYSIRQNGKTIPIFSDTDSSRGSLVEAACVGKKNRAIVLSGEFSANALQGFVLTSRAGQHVVGRLHFAEKSRPTWIFLNAEEAIVVVPTNGLGETSKKYRLYRAPAGVDKEPAAQGVDRLPHVRGYELVKLSGG